jgi:hypothetical protein
MESGYIRLWGAVLCGVCEQRKASSASYPSLQRLRPVSRCESSDAFGLSGVSNERIEIAQLSVAISGAFSPLFYLRWGHACGFVVHSGWLLRPKRCSPVSSSLDKAVIQIKSAHTVECYAAQRQKLKDGRFLLVRTEVHMIHPDKAAMNKIVRNTSTILCSINRSRNRALPGVTFN